MEETIGICITRMLITFTGALFIMVGIKNFERGRYYTFGVETMLVIWLAAAMFDTYTW